MSVPEIHPRLLIVDDDEAIHPIVERVARRLGFDVHSRSRGGEALAALPDLRPDVALVDLRMPELSGIDVLKAVRAADPECQVILMTGAATVDTAIEAVQAGALDYLSKPFDFDRLSKLLVGVRDRIRQRREVLRIDGSLAKQFEFHSMIGRSRPMQELFDAIRRLAPHARTVLVSGETGTGKELVARALHDEGPRRSKRFVSVNCSAVVETLFESELFGHVRGAFTGANDTKVGMFEHATGGTLFLDETGELPLSLQAKLLRAVEYGEIQRVGSLEVRKADVSIIAATNRDLRAEVAAGRFRSDLYYRLSTIEVHLPPLRERREDIPYLTAAFVRQCSERMKRPISGVTSGAERLLQEAPWPGNIRELRNVIERACILTDSSMLTEREFIGGMASTAPSQETPLSDEEPPIGKPNPSLEYAQREQIQRALRAAAGNKAEAAKILGVSRRSLYRWIERLEISYKIDVKY